MDSFYAVDMSNSAICIVQIKRYLKPFLQSSWIQETIINEIWIYISKKIHFSLELKVLNILEWGLKFYNYSSFCMVPLFLVGCSIGGTLVFHWYSRAFRWFSVVFRCSVAIPLFRRCSVFCCSLVFLWYAGIPCSAVPCSWFYSIPLTSNC